MVIINYGPYRASDSGRVDDGQTNSVLFDWICLAVDCRIVPYSIFIRASMTMHGSAHAPHSHGPWQTMASEAEIRNAIIHNINMPPPTHHWTSSPSLDSLHKPTIYRILPYRSQPFTLSTTPKLKLKRRPSSADSDGAGADNDSDNEWWWGIRFRLLYINIMDIAMTEGMFRQYRIHTQQ